MATDVDDRGWKIGVASAPTGEGGRSGAGAMLHTGGMPQGNGASTLRSPNAVIGQGCRIAGKLEFEGDVQLNGEVQGEIFSQGELVVGETAVIQANLNGRVVRVFGRVQGNITCSHRLELNGGAAVTGDLTSPSLVIREGVVFEGRCSMPSAAEGESLVGNLS